MPDHKMFALAVLLLLVPRASSPCAFGEVTFEWATIGDPGNAPDPAFTAPVGSVDCVYRIAKYEVTNAQFVEFINAASRGQFASPRVAEIREGIDLVGGTGTTADPYVFQAAPGQENHPITSINRYSALSFINWLEKGQPDVVTSRDVTSGAYTPFNSSGGETRVAGSTYFLPNYDEWHKAAYYESATGEYYEYATSSNERPYSVPPPGTAAPDPTNVANYQFEDGIDNGFNDGFAVSFPHLTQFLTPVGAYPLTTSPYGLYDMNGNVAEILENQSGSSDVTAGGGWRNPDAPFIDFDYLAGGLGFSSKVAGGDSSGLRIGSRFVVPEPSSSWLCLSGVIALISLRRFQSRRSR